MRLRTDIHDPHGMNSAGFDVMHHRQQDKVSANLRNNIL